VPGKNPISDRVSVLTDYGETLVVVANKWNRFSSPMGIVLREGPGRSWVPSNIPNTPGVE